MKAVMCHLRDKYIFSVLGVVDLLPSKRFVFLHGAFVLWTIEFSEECGGIQFTVNCER